MLKKMTTNNQGISFTLISLLSFGSFIILRDLDISLTKPFYENFINLSFELLLFIPIILITIKPVENFIIESIKINKGFPLAFFPIGFSAFYYFLAYTLNFNGIELHLKELSQLFYTQGSWILSLFLSYGFLLLLFRLSLLLMEQRINKNFLNVFFTHKESFKETKILLVLLITLSPLITNIYNWGLYSLLTPFILFSFFFLSQIPSFKYSRTGFTPSDFFSLLPLGLLPLIFQKILFIQPQVPLTLILICLFYGGGPNKIGSNYFHYNYHFKSSKVPEFILLSLISLVLLLVVSFATDFIRLENFQTKELEFYTLLKRLNVWFYYVGISEEIVFKIILLKLIYGFFLFHQRKSMKNSESIAIIFSACIFGLAHAVKGWNYAFSAFLAGSVTGYFYLRYKGLLAPIFFHMLLDIIAISIFQAKL